MSMDEVRYQVFVSSTFTDLKVEREKVLQAILEQRAFPAGMELFPSADEEQFEFIKREIDSSDYYVLIIAGRYGSVADDGISFTEKEFDYAVSKGKPVLSFLHHDIQQLIGEKLEPSDAGKNKLKAFRDKAKKSRLISQYQNPDDLKSKVLTSLASQFNLKPMRGWVRSGHTSRSDLERITLLQQRVIELEAENAKLRIQENSAAAQLASGSSLINWELDIADCSFGGIQTTSKTVQLESSWDFLLQVIFPGGSSFATVDQIEVRLFSMVTQLVAETEKNPQWAKNASNAVTDIGGVSKYNFVRRLLEDLHRQFTGLGFIEEVRETAYRYDYQHGSRPFFRQTWRLTAKGEQHIALTRGYLKESIDK
jgi:hypothetical protein